MWSLLCWGIFSLWASQVPQQWRNCLPVLETRVWSLGWEDPLEKEMTTHSSILAWEIPWMEETGRLESMRLQSQIQLREWVCSVCMVWLTGKTNFGGDILKIIYFHVIKICRKKVNDGGKKYTLRCAHALLSFSFLSFFPIIFLLYLLSPRYLEQWGVFLVF